MRACKEPAQGSNVAWFEGLALGGGPRLAGWLAGWLGCGALMWNFKLSDVELARVGVA